LCFRAAMQTNAERNSGVVPFLPQPGPEVKFPEKVNAHANVSVLMIRPGTKGGEELRDGVSEIAGYCCRDRT
jgi:hypothetical protein